MQQPRTVPPKKNPTRPDSVSVTRPAVAVAEGLEVVVGEMPEDEALSIQVLDGTAQVPGQLDGPLQVYKHNKLASACYQLTARADKFVMFAITKIDPTDFELKKTYTIHADEFAEWAGLDANAVRRDLWAPPASLKIKSIAAEVGGEFLVINNVYYPARGIITALGTHWFSDVRPETQQGYCSYLDVKFSEALAPYLIELHKGGHFYTTARTILRLLEGRYAMRLYGWIRSIGYRLIKPQGRIRVSVDDLRRTLGTDAPLGVKNAKMNRDCYQFGGNTFERKLSNYGHFKERALLVAVQEISKKTDLIVTFEEKRGGGSTKSSGGKSTGKGKGVHTIEFIITVKDEASFPKGFVPELPPSRSQSGLGTEQPSSPSPSPKARQEELALELGGLTIPQSRSDAAAVVAPSDGKEEEQGLVSLITDLSKKYGGFTSEQRKRLAWEWAEAAGCTDANSKIDWLLRLDRETLKKESDNAARDYIAAAQGNFMRGARTTRLKPTPDPRQVAKQLAKATAPNGDEAAMALPPAALPAVPTGKIDLKKFDLKKLVESQILEDRRAEGRR